MRMNRLSFVRAGALLAALLAVAPAEAVNFPAGTHTFVLTVKNDLGAIASSRDGYSIEISTIAAPSVVLADGPVGDSDVNGVNCILAVPMSTDGGEGTVKSGESVRVTLFRAPGETKLGAMTLTVGDSDDVSRYYLQMSEMIAYTVDGRTLSVPKAYVDAWQTYFDQEGKGPYDPFADTDGDGFSNYDEYLAGTDPLDPSSKLAIVSFALENGDWLIGFRSVPDQVYTLQGTDSLGAGAVWRDIPFRLTSDGVEMRTFAYPYEEGSYSELTVFRARMPADRAKFYRINTK